MKMALKCGNDKFSAMIVKPVSGPIGLGNRPRSPKLWLYLMKTALKCKKDKFSIMTLKPVSGLTSLVNRPRTPKLWVIAHENGSKT